MPDKIRIMAAIVVELQAQYDAENYSTTSVDFMREHGKDWMIRRKEALALIDHARTEAIWALGKLLSADDRRNGRRLSTTSYVAAERERRERAVLGTA